MDKRFCPKILTYWPNSHKHNLSKADTCLKRTKILVPNVSALDRVYCIYIFGTNNQKHLSQLSHISHKRKAHVEEGNQPKSKKSLQVTLKITLSYTACVAQLFELLTYFIINCFMQNIHRSNKGSKKCKKEGMW